MLCLILHVTDADSFPKALSRKEEEHYVSRMMQGDAEARKMLIEHNLRLVAYIAKRFENTGANIEELISIGTVGLMKAINTFQTDKNIKLATYASRCIENEILDWAGNVIQVNYMYSIFPENPVLQLFYNLVPHPYWYMFLCIPVIVLYLACIYVKDIVKGIKQLGSQKHAR